MIESTTSSDDTANELDPLAQKVTKSLVRFGYTNVLATHVGGRTIRLSGETETSDERALVIAIARTVPGVVGVRFT